MTNDDYVDDEAFLEFLDGVSTSNARQEQMAILAEEIMEQLPTCEYCPNPHGAAVINLPKGGSAVLMPATDFETYADARQMLDTLLDDIDDGVSIQEAAVNLVNSLRGKYATQPSMPGQWAAVVGDA